jgi:hypothetical protein
MKVTRETQVEDIVQIPGAVSYFIERGVSPISCSGAFPQSLGRLLELKKVADPERFIAELNAWIEEHCSD